MIRVDLTGGRELTEADIKRSGALPREVMDAAEAIVDDVRANGDAAVRAYCEKFDGSCPTAFRVPDELLDAAPSMVDEQFLSSLRLAHDQVRAFHEREVSQSMFTTRADGTLLGVKVTPLPSVGIYVPGGRAQYPSTVLMNAVPAKVAGVRRIVMVTPPQRDGSLSAYTLAAAKVAGVDEVYAVGGAQAVAALTYGAGFIPKVDKLVGPGNAFVATAKRMAYGELDIDMVAGPSEVLVIADGSAQPKFVAADLLSQAEHDKLASAVLLTDSMELARAVDAEIIRQTGYLSRSEIMECSLRDFGCAIVCENLDDCAALANEIAPEHLEVCVDQPFDYLDRIRNAGSIFLGRNCPEALGDLLWPDPHHTLPTSGTARFSSPLSGG